MAKSTHTFKRWDAKGQLSWAHQVYRKYDIELFRLVDAHFLASQYIYQDLGTKAKWEDKLETTLGFHPNDIDQYGSVKDWSENYNKFSNWTNLNTLLTLASMVAASAATIGVCIMSEF